MKKPIGKRSAARTSSRSGRVEARRAVAKVFWSGRSQALRLPKEFRLDVDEVRIHREGKTLVIEPIEEKVDKNGWPLGFFERLRERAKDPEVQNFEVPKAPPMDERDWSWMDE